MGKGPGKMSANLPKASMQLSQASKLNLKAACLKYMLEFKFFFKLSFYQGSSLQCFGVHFLQDLSGVHILTECYHAVVTCTWRCMYYLHLLVSL